ncbi:MAG: aryl-sulfate sulfotransferase [Myxococcota bacterium]
MWLGWILACQEHPSDTGADPSTPSDPTIDGTTPSTPTTTGPQPCAADPDLSVTRFAIEEPSSFHKVKATVKLSKPASLAVACTRRDDPTEVHLLESDEATSHTLKFVGLRGGTDYDCVAAPVCPTVDGAPATASFRTVDTPDSTASAFVQNEDGYTATGAYTLADIKPDCGGGDDERNYLVILDPNGEPRWRYDLPDGLNVGIEAEVDAGSTGSGSVLWAGGESTDGAPRLVDLFDGEVWKLAGPNGRDDIVYHHDGKRIFDGRILSVELNYDPGWQAFQLRLVDQASGDTTWLYDSTSAVEEGHLWPGSPDDEDPHHLNWADVVDTPSGPVAYGSLCYAYQIVSIDATTGAFRWRLGPGGDLDLRGQNGRPLGGDEFPQCQHGLQTDGESLLVYDNGWDRGYTRVVEYAIDEDARTATVAWEWTEADRYLELYHGGADWLTSDHQRILVTESNNDCDVERHSQFVEVDRATGDVVQRMTLRRVSDFTYRSHRAGGCELFANAAWCPAVADRLAALDSVLHSTR